MPDDQTPQVRLRLDVLGSSCVVEFAGSCATSLADEAQHAWARCNAERIEAADDSTDVVRVLCDDDPEVVRAAGGQGMLAATDPAAVMDALSPAVTVQAIGHQAGRLLMFHAGAVAGPDGRTLVLVGPSGAGKTTAIRTLARRWGYVTDETVAVDDDGVVTAYPKPLSVLDDGSHYKRQVSADDLDLRRPPETCTLHRVVMLERDGSETPWLEPVATLHALARLAPETSYLARLERPLHRLAETLAGCGGLSVLHYAEATDLPDVVSQLLEED